MPTLSADEVRTIRMDAGLTQQQLADRIGVSVDTVRSWEQGYRRPLGTATKLLLMLAEETRAQEEGRDAKAG
jgi:putative transcriptional regulator